MTRQRPRTCRPGPLQKQTRGCHAVTTARSRDGVDCARAGRARRTSPCCGPSGPRTLRLPAGRRAPPRQAIGTRGPSCGANASTIPKTLDTSARKLSGTRIASSRSQRMRRLGVRRRKRPRRRRLSRGRTGERTDATRSSVAALEYPVRSFSVICWEAPHGPLRLRAECGSSRASGVGRGGNPPRGPGAV